MNEKTKSQKGSPARDSFKYEHKNRLSRKFYASDCDLCFISFEPEGVVAYIDYKKTGDKVTKTEEVLYSEWTKTKPVYIVESPVKLIDEEICVEGPFRVNRFRTKDDLEFVCVLNDWKEFEDWEGSLRKDFAEEQLK